jgi:hypothetical protein
MPEGNFTKPTVEQTAWVISCLIKNAKEHGSFRYLIYDTMGYGTEAYTPLYLAGGMAINNILYDYIEEGKKVQ